MGHPRSPPAGSAPTAGTFWWVIAGVAGVGLGLRVAYVLTVGGDVRLGLDATWYSLQAAIIGDGRGYLDPQAFFQHGRSIATGSFPPAWPALLGLVDAIGPSSQQAFQLVGAVVGTATIVLTAALGRLVANARIGIAAAVIIALSPAMIASDGSIMSDSLCVALLVATAIMCSRALARPTATRFACLGVIGGLAALARNDSLVVVMLLAAVAAFANPQLDLRRAFRLALVSVALVVAIIGPWALRNSLALGKPVASSTNIGTLVEGANCPSTFSGSLLGMWDKHCQVETRRPGVAEPDWSEAAIRRGIAYVRSEAQRVPLVVDARLARSFGLWNPYSQAPLEAQETRDHDFQIAAWLYGLVTFLVAIPGAVVLARRHGRPALPLAAMVAGTLVIVALSWGNPRFRLPAEPAIAIAAAATLCARRSRPDPPPAEARSTTRVRA